MHTLIVRLTHTYRGACAPDYITLQNTQKLFKIRKSCEHR